MDEIYPATRHQRCWFHKISNVLGKFPKSMAPTVKADLQEIHHAETKAKACASIKLFEEKYGIKYAPAVNCLIKDEEAMRPARSFGQDVRDEPDFSRRRVGCVVPNLLTLDRDWADPCLDDPFRPDAIPNDALPAVRQTFTGKHLDETINFSLQRGCKHELRYFSRDLRQRVQTGIRLAKRDDRATSFVGVSLHLTL